MERMIVVRFDDICPTMNYEQFMRADEILREYNIKPLLGVIPKCKDPELQIDDYHDRKSTEFNLIWPVHSTCTIHNPWNPI